MPIQSTDTTTGIVFDSDHEVWTIKAGVQVTVSGGGFGVNINQDACTLDNAGGITADYGVYVGAAGSDCVVVNRSGAEVISRNDAVRVSGADGLFVLQNAGSLHGGQDGVFVQNAAARITNTGSVDGGFSAVSLLGGGSTLINSGDLVGGDYGIDAHLDAGQVATIRNTGTIQGGDNVGIYLDPTSQGSLVIDNLGEVTGGIDIRGSQGFARLTNAGLIDGFVFLGDGPNRFDGRGGTVIGDIQGGAYSDFIVGGSGDDTLIGGLGSDTLDGGKGSGEDTFRYNDVKESRASAPDLISRHFGAEDSILLNFDANAKVRGFQEVVFGGAVAPGAALTTGVVDYYQQNGDTYVVVDTSGDGQADFRLQIHGLVTPTADQFVF